MADTAISPEILLKMAGREAASPVLPPLLQPTSRAGGHAEDPFLPAGYLRPTGSFDVGPAARGAPGGDRSAEHRAAPDEIVVLELADGGTLVTSVGRLREGLGSTRPELIGDDGAILLERLRAEGAAARGVFGDALGGLVSKVFTLTVSPAPDAIIEAAVRESGIEAALLGASWAGTRALMWAIESRLDRQPGLYRWDGGADLPPEAADFRGQAPVDPRSGAPAPMLVFLHGTGSSTMGSFGEMARGSGAELWAALEERFTGGIYAFEHRTLSESPIDNALALARALPPGARISLVSHSRGGLVADLLCLKDFGGLVERFRRGFEGTGDADAGAAAADLRAELDTAHAGHREQLHRLAGVLADKRLTVERYVRTASPANGTRLASGNFDLFLSGLLTLIGQVPFFFGNPYYSAFKRVAIEIARNRTDPHLVPGIEAMLPDSPLARLLRDAAAQDGIRMAVIAGDSEGGHLLRRLGLLLTDFVLFDNEANDLVVDTAAMLAGVATKSRARVLFDRGPDVSHFRYFVNPDTRTALRDWLVAEQPQSLAAFADLPAPDEFEAALAAALPSRDATAAARPVVVVLPGVMGSNLKVRGHDRIWFDLPDIAAGGLKHIRWEAPDVDTDDLFARTYGKLCRELSRSHRVERFAYDWRQPLDVLAERLGSFLDKLLKETTQPVRLLAHSMGGLVVRACIHKRRPVMDALMKREGARLVMLGTPNQGAHSMVENLIGKGDTLRTLVVADLRHDMQQVLDIVAGFRGALQLLPRPGFTDTFQDRPGQPPGDGGAFHHYQDAATWQALRQQVRDPWFGDRRCAVPAQPVLDEASWLWREDERERPGRRPALPDDYEKKSVYVFGVAPNTPCGVREVKDWRGRTQLKMVGTALGDGTVTWESGRIDGIGAYYYMPAVHGDLTASPEHFEALVELLASGATARLPASPPALRAIARPAPLTYDASPPAFDDALAVERRLMGGSLHERLPARARRRLEVKVRAEDLRFLSVPILVGHYEQDPIAGPEALIDRELLDGELSQRHGLGLYAGACGTATVVLRAPNAHERERGSLRGAVVTGLGKYDGALSLQTLTEAVRTGVLRYLLQVIDVLGKDKRELPLAMLLLGYNSAANLSVNASVEALVSGVMEANARFHEATGLDIRVTRLEIVELYLDTAITAVYALRALASRLAERAAAERTTLVVQRELAQGEGLRQRLFDERSSGYWPRLIVTDADRNDAACPPECYSAPPGGVAAGAAAPAPRTRLADNLRFLYVGQRARAESVVQQRQPGLIEALVRQQINSPAWQPDFGRMLFQLMVPPDFKDAARQLDRVVLVVDSATANLPWELMLADDPGRPDADKRPLALRTAVVRQLASVRFRRQVRQGAGRKALVIGNPSVEGFGAHFPGPKPAAAPKDPDNLPGAEAEANTVVALLRGMGYEVGQVIGPDRTASVVLAALYREPYRLLHISGHGVYNVGHLDGRARSGVVLSDGLLVTAAEIDAMETVPELVFLNCCHLGQIEHGRDGNRLAASVARELIEVGVRCVVVAGWAVNDESAQHFGRVFYEQLLLHRRPFGEAVFEARLAVWKAYPQDITWGAFQAYGDAGWRVDPRADDASSRDGDRYASLDELLDELARTRATLSRRSDRLVEREGRKQVQAIEDKLNRRCPPGWLALPPLQSALGATWRALGRLDKAREAFRKAVQAEDRAGRVPIRDIEQLAHVETHLGAKLGDEEGTQAEPTGADAAGEGRPGGEAPPPRAETALELIDLAIRRLEGLDAVVAADAHDPAGLLEPNGERSALRGSAFKRKAAYHALRVLREAAGPARDAAAGAMREALEHAVAAYKRAEGDPAGGRFRPYNALNRLALDALTPWERPEHRDAAIALAEQCRNAVAQEFAREPDVWKGLMQPEALLVARLLDGSYGADGETGRQAVEEVARAYAESLCNLTLKPSELDSTTGQMELLARLYLALSVSRRGAEDAHRAKRIGDRLLDLVRRLQPGRPRPGFGTAPAAPRAPLLSGGGSSGDEEAPPPALAPAPAPSLTDGAAAGGSVKTARARRAPRRLK